MNFTIFPFTFNGGLKNMDILNFDFLYNILENGDEDTKKILFFSLVNNSKNNRYLYQYIDVNWIKEMLNKIEFIEDIYEKADIISFLVGAIYENEFKIDCNEIERLFYLYLKTLQSGYGADVVNTLHYFLNLGISLEIVVTECIKICRNDVFIHLFSKLPEIDKCKVGKNNEKFVSLIEQHRKMITRFDLVLHFHLITSYDYAKNILIAEDYLNKYYNYMIICADWAFSREYSRDNLVVENIITNKELQLFVELGNILDECKKLEVKQKTDTEEELFEYLYKVSEQLKLLLKSDKIKNIRKRFFGEKDFFEVAFSLPDNQY